MEIKWLFILFFSYTNCENELIAINCKDKIIKYFQEKSNWRIGNNSNSCPKNGDDILKICINAFNNQRFNYVKYIESKSKNPLLNGDYKIYKCLINKNSEALDVPSGCEFKHTLNDANPCLSEEEWKAKAKSLCSNNHVAVITELVKFSALFKCEISDSKPIITYKSIQYVCCPKLDAYDSYRIHLKDINSTVKSEKQAFELAKKTLLKRFKQRQKDIRERFILEENSINNLTKHPKLASSLENTIQNTFKNKFMLEMYSEVNLLKELEIIHENRMQTLFEENRKGAKARLEYTLQETNPQASRITEALKLELQSILSESEDIMDFYKTLLKEGLSTSESNRKLIRENFNSLVILSWNEVIKILNKVPDLKDKILSNIRNFNMKKEKLIERFKYLDKDYSPPISMKSQAENFVKNMISLYGHGLVEKKSYPIKKHEKESIATIIIIILICLSIMFLMAISILLYRFHGKINSYLSNTFKKIHPPNKSLLVQIENYPFKNRYNYGNGIYQPYFKSEESIIGHPNSVYNQHFSSVNESTNDGLKKSLESDFNESSISNINGLENPICRLLDEK